MNSAMRGAPYDNAEIRGFFENHIARTRYTYNFHCLGRPIIQVPQDMIAMQELIWDIKPDLIVETGIAHGGSLVMSAAMLSLIEYCDAARNGRTLDPAKPQGMVLGIDIDIREHNRTAIEAHPMGNRIKMIQGSSIDPKIVSQVTEIASTFKRVLVCLDSNHTHEHALAELNAYARLVSVGSYCVVFDTAIEDLPADLFPDRPWGPGDNPKTAVRSFLADNTNFQVDTAIDNKLLITVAPDGYLRRAA
ncbi:MAG: cephalosporin hydroxylase family protein [Planctomycetaceae bacterium]